VAGTGIAAAIPDTCCVPAVIVRTLKISLIEIGYTGGEALCGFVIQARWICRASCSSGSEIIEQGCFHGHHPENHADRRDRAAAGAWTRHRLWSKVAARR